MYGMGALADTDTLGCYGYPQQMQIQKLLKESDTDTDTIAEYRYEYPQQIRIRLLIVGMDTLRGCICPRQWHIRRNGRPQAWRYVVDRPTQLIYIGIFICCQHPSTKT